MNITLTKWSLESEKRLTQGQYTSSLPSRAGLRSVLEMVNQGRFSPTSTSARPRLMIKLAAPVSNLTSRTPALHRPTPHLVLLWHLELIVKSRGNAYSTSSLVHYRRRFRLRNPSIWTACSITRSRHCSIPMSTISVSWRRSHRNLPCSLLSLKMLPRRPHISTTISSSTPTKTLNYISYNSWGCARSRPGRLRCCRYTVTSTQSRSGQWQIPK